jgi:hypothetical protein
MPYPKKKIHLPIIWSPEEVATLIEAAPIPFYRTNTNVILASVNGILTIPSDSQFAFHEQ